ncbi:MAG: hypothetical protein ACI90V_012433 [Bacillariaceae sp.]|jgi:hypothetical protein
MEYKTNIINIVLYNEYVNFGCVYIQYIILYSVNSIFNRKRDVSDR